MLRAQVLKLELWTHAFIAIVEVQTMVMAEDWEVQERPRRKERLPRNGCTDLRGSWEGLCMCRAVGRHHNTAKVRLRMRAAVWRAGLEGRQSSARAWRQI